MFPVADGTGKTRGGDRRLKPSTLIRGRPEQIFLGKSDELSSPNPLQDHSTRDDVEAQNDIWTVTEDFNRHPHVVPRVKLYMPKEDTFRVPMKYIDVTRTTCTSLDVLLEKYGRLLERRWSKRIIGCMDRLPKICFN